jgi:hypothetical protein
MHQKIFLVRIKNLINTKAEMNACLCGQWVLPLKNEYVADGENSAESPGLTFRNAFNSDPDPYSNENYIAVPISRTIIPTVMNIPRVLPAFLLTLFASTAHSGPRTSASYSILTDTADGGGNRAISASYTHDGSAGDFVGISTVAAPAETAKAGYLGQLTEVTALQLAATPTTVNETATRQVTGVQLLDDLTTNAVSAASISWSVQSGPLNSLNSSGIATAGTVYQNTAAAVQGSYAGATGILALTVIDNIPDNFGSYSADGVGDDWQFQYFGLNNSNAAPLLDPDGDGQNNLFEFTAGLVPTNSLSRFFVSIAPVPGQAMKKQIVFNPVVAGRSYTVKASPDLSLASWNPLAGSTSSDNGNQRTVTDNSATGGKKFYKVEIVKP